MQIGKESPTAGDGQPMPFRGNSAVIAENLVRYENTGVGTVRLSGSTQLRFWMSVGQSLSWPPLSARNHLGMHLAVLPLRCQLPGCGREDGSSRRVG